MEKGKWWVKLIRVLLYAIAIVGATIGVGLIKRSMLSQSYADGTADAKATNGDIFLFTSIIIIIANMVWGTVRWFLRGQREQWTVGAMIGKIIGGGIWRFFAIAPVIILSFLFLVPQVSLAISNNLAKGEYEPVSLSAREDRLRYLVNNYENMEKDEIIKELEETSYNFFDFGLDASNNVSTNDSASWWPWGAKKASAYSHTITILNKAKLSSKRRFVVFYTDTGDDQISDERAAELCEMLEDIIDRYKSTFGFEYTYERLTNGSTTYAARVIAQQSVLKNAGIDANILDTAMPVYVVEPFEKGSSVLASYAGKNWLDLREQLLLGINNLLRGTEQGLLYDSSPSFPFINITPRSANSDGLPPVVAHELGHHFASTYNYSDDAPGNDDDFIKEALANWLSINALPDQPENTFVNNNYSGAYLNCYKSTISNACPNYTGYPAVAFFESYSRIVPDAVDILMESSRHEDPLGYLYERASQDNYRRVMTDLAERMITLEWDGKINTRSYPMGEDWGACNKICQKQFEMNPSSTSFIWLSTESLQDSHVWATGNDYTRVSIIGRTRGDRKMKILNSGEIEASLFITKEIVEQYENIIIAVANSSISEKSEYTAGTILQSAMDLLEDINSFSGSDFADLYQELRPGCYQVDTDSIFDKMLGFIGLGSQLLKVVEELNPEYTGAQNGYDLTLSEASQGITTAKNALAPYRISVCTNDISPDLTFETAKSRLQGIGTLGLNVYEGGFGTDKISAFVDFDLFTESARVYVLAGHQGINGLITVDITSK